MRALGLQGVVRGRPRRTTVPTPVSDHPADRVQRDFDAPQPNALWVTDLTYVATWRGFVYVVLVIDAFARRIDLALDALEQAVHERGPERAH